MPGCGETFRRSTIGNATPALAAPPDVALHDATLFLDLDGTLFELVDSPADVRADHRTQALIGQLLQHMDGRVAVVSGRSLAQIDDMLGDAAGRLWISGSHGSEHRWDGVIQGPSRPDVLDDVAARCRTFARDRPGVLVEEKSLGVALHYRTAPDAGASALSLARKLTGLHDLYLQHGKSMVEMRVGSANKGNAIHAMMAHPRLAGTTPVFAGDDVTDEPGFEAVLELGGHAILVGEPRPTLATFGLRSPVELREWLWRVTA